MNKNAHIFLEWVCAGICYSFIAGNNMVGVINTDKDKGECIKNSVEFCWTNTEILKGLLTEI